MSFIGRNGYFGALTPYTGAYHPSVYRKYSRGGGPVGGGYRLGNAFAYKRPQFDDGGAVDDTDAQIQNTLQQFAPQQQQRQPGQVESMMRAMQQWGQGPSGVSQRFANPGLYDIQRASYELQQTTDPDTADKIQGHTDKILKVAAADPDTPPLPSLKRAQGGNVAASVQRAPHKYRKPPHNNANNDRHQGHSAGRDAISYTWGKVSPRFQNQGAEITPHGHNEVTPRKRAHGGGCSCWRCGGRFAKGGAAITAWKDRPYPVAQRTANGLKINAPHSGEGLILDIHLSDVGPHALSLTHSGGVNVERMADRSLQADARPTNPFMPQAPSIAGLGGPGQFGAMIGQLPYGVKGTP
jgi:hypothetical protein